MPPAANVLHPLRAGPASGTALLRALQLPRPTLSRVLHELQREGQVLQVGEKQRARYALPRKIPGAGSSWPVFQVDPAGRVQSFGRLDALMPHHFHFETPHEALRGLTEGLPWFLNALRPAGFLGRALDLPRAPGETGDEVHGAEDTDIAWLIRHGWDGPGDLILGAEALEALRSALPHRVVVQGRDRPRQYMRMAEAALEKAGTPAAQLPGESPKFTAITDHGGHVVPVLVKFSPPLTTPEGQRGGELLVAEHLAHGFLGSRGVFAVHSRVFRFGGRIFLEIDRFDRVGAEGRRAVVSLAALDLPRTGSPCGWAVAAGQLAGAGLLPKNDARQIRLIEAFAGLIGHTARDAGDLSLFYRADGGFALAPAYDLAPTVFAPRSGNEAALEEFTPPRPAPLLLDVWPQACRLAEAYWERLAAETQFSAAFRAQCAAALFALRAMPQVPPPPQLG
jgi:hypothetical protein